MADSTVDIVLIPYAESGNPPSSLQAVERKLKEGIIVKIGRQVIKDGQVQTKTNAHGLDIWYASKVISRNHAELWAKDGQIYIRDIGSSSGTFLNKMRLSPSGKGSRPYPLKNGDVIQFGVDYKGKTEDIFKAVVLKVGFSDGWSSSKRRQGNPVKFQQALKNLLAATNPYASNTDTNEDASNISTECCICIGAIGPYQALFISPCSHCFHYKCVSVILAQSAMFQCPMCRQVANLTASVSMESLNELDAAEATPTNLGSDSDLSMVSGSPISGPMAQMMGSLQGRLENQHLSNGNVSLPNGSPISRPMSATSGAMQSTDSTNAAKGKTFSIKFSSLIGRKPSTLLTGQPNGFVGPSPVHASGSSTFPTGKQGDTDEDASNEHIQPGYHHHQQQHPIAPQSDDVLEQDAMLMDRPDDEF